MVASSTGTGSVTTSAPTAGGLSVAVLDLKAEVAEQGIARAMTTLVTSEVGGHAGFRAVSRNELKAIIAHQSEASLLGCAEPRCAADVARLVDADRVITGEVSRAEGGAVVLSLSLIDPEGPTVLDRLAWTWRAPTGTTRDEPIDGVLDLARPAVDRVLQGAAATGFSGGVEVLALAGATIVVDGKDQGTTPRGPVTGLAIGPHTVEVRKPGFLTYTTDVAVTRGENRVVTVDLVDETSLQPVWARWYVWGSALAGAVVIGGTVAAVGTWNYMNTPSRLVVGASAK
jgi:TolB-like protein